jgi:uncharacterized protein DUF4436
MRIPVPRIRLLIVILVGFLYVAVLIRNLNESTRRSLQVHEEVGVENHVRVIVRIVEVAVNPPQVKVRLSFRPVGNLAKDKVTPARDLKLFLNVLRGPQEIDFPSGEPMSPIEADFPLEGDSNKYPFDRYQTILWLFMTTPAPTITGKPNERKTASGSNVAAPAETVPPIADLAVSVVAMELNPVPIFIDVAAAIPGIKFNGKISRTPGQDVTGVDLYLRRTDNVIMVSICMMIIMMCLAMSLLAMVLQVTTVHESTLLPLSLSVSLIFGLPALRNVQPSVPPVGVFGDYVSFIWAELIVALATVMVVWTWIAKSRKPQSAEQSHAPAHIA